MDSDVHWQLMMSDMVAAAAERYCKVEDFQLMVTDRTFGSVVDAEPYLQLMATGRSDLVAIIVL